MHALFLFSLGAASLGGAVALGAMFYYARLLRAERRPEPIPIRDEPLRARESADRSLIRPRREQASSELARKRAELDRLNAQAERAARAMNLALDSIPFQCALSQDRLFEEAKPFETSSFDE